MKIVPIVLSILFVACSDAQVTDAGVDGGADAAADVQSEAAPCISSGSPCTQGPSACCSGGCTYVSPDPDAAADASSSALCK